MGQNLLNNQILDLMMRNNPKAKEVMDELKKSGCTPKDFFYKKANEMGVNPMDVLRQIM